MTHQVCQKVVYQGSKRTGDSDRRRLDVGSGSGSMSPASDRVRKDLAGVGENSLEMLIVI